MFVILLEFSTNASQAKQHMEGHKTWLQRGFDDGLFLVSGSLKPGPGGAVLATAPSLEAIRERVAQDPFVEHDIVKPSIVEFTAAKADPRLQFLVD